jgi:hypothetical protein
MVILLELPTGTKVGLNERLLSLGRPETVAVAKLMAVLNPFVPVTVTVVLADAPGDATVTVAGAKVMLKSGPGLTCTGTEPEEPL